MKKRAIFFLIFSVLIFSACTAQNKSQLSNSLEKAAADILQVDDQGNTKINTEVLGNYLQQAGAAELSPEEIAGIKFMLEEEKLARDVYKKLYEKWQQQNFDNISQSEATHISAVRGLAEKYGVDIQFYNDEIGKFTNSELSSLYNQLVAKGDESLSSALEIGALIEEIDIADLEEYIKQTNNGDIILVYENLMRGSRNHLRSFVRTMSRQGQNYEPQHLDKANYETIINSENERGGYGQAQGQGQKKIKAPGLSAAEL